MGITNAAKKVTAFLIAIVCILLNAISSFAYDNSIDEFIRKAQDYRIIVVDQNETIIGTITIDIDKLYSSQRYLNSIKNTAFEEWDRRFKTEVMGLDSVEENSECRLTVFCEEFNNPLYDICDYKGSGAFSKTSITKKTVTVVNNNYPSMSYTTTYYAHVTVNYNQSNNVITAVTGTSFHTSSLSYDYATENIYFAYFVAPDGHSCGSTANYTLYKYWDVYGIPIKFSKNCADYVIAYNYEH